MAKHRLPVHSRPSKGGRYWICYVRTPDGRRLQRALHIRDDGSKESERAAIAAYWQEQSRVTAGTETRRSKTRTLRSALKALAEAKEVDEQTEHSQEKVTSAGKALELFFGDQHDIGSITTEDLVSFAAERKKVVENITIKRDLQVYSQACAAVGVTPAKLPGIGSIQAKPQEPFTLDEVRRFMLATTPHGKLLAYCLHFLGLRNSETRKLAEPDWANKRVWCEGTKTKHSKRWVYPPDEMWEYMEAMRSVGEWRGWPKLGKQGVESFVKRTSARAGLGHRHPNDCRGGFATRLAAAGVNAALRGAIMGNSEQTQKIYSQPHLLDQELADASRKHPRIRPKPCTADASQEAAQAAKTAVGGTVTALKSLRKGEDSAD